MAVVVQYVMLHHKDCCEKGRLKIEHKLWDVAKDVGVIRIPIGMGVNMGVDVGLEEGAKSPAEIHEDLNDAEALCGFASPIDGHLRDVFQCADE